MVDIRGLDIASINQPNVTYLLTYIGYFLSIPVLIINFKLRHITALTNIHAIDTSMTLQIINPFK